MHPFYPKKKKKEKGSTSIFHVTNADIKSCLSCHPRHFLKSSDAVLEESLVFISLQSKMPAGPFTHKKKKVSQWKRTSLLEAYYLRVVEGFCTLFVVKAKNVGKREPALV